MTIWYWSEGGAPPQGPVPREEVLQAIQQGRASARALICLVGESSWQPITSVPDFNAALRQQPPPPVPMQQPQVVYYAPAKTRLAYVLLGLFLGGLGIHNFYAGYTNRGVIQLVITLAGGWLVAPLCIVWVWNVVEVLTTTTDASGQPFS